MIRPFPKPRYKWLPRQKAPKMTIALGFQCADGTVLCADSLESDGVTIKNVQKIWTYQVGEEWGVAIASAGEADLADSFNDDLRDLLGNSGFDQKRLLNKLRGAIGQTRMSYPDSQFAMLITLFTNTALPHRNLYRVMDGSAHLGPVSRYQSIGIGSHLASFLCSQLYRDLMFVEDAVRLGAFCLARVKEYVDGCGGPTSICSHTTGEKFWRHRIGQEAAAIEAGYPAIGLKKALWDYWKASNPPFKWEQLTNMPIVDPGEAPGPKYVITAKLGTKL